jgi:pyruvate dehydrogenase E2 component (dihydrolipoamide acetyltransferase)
MADYLLPDVGEGLTEAELVSWKVAVGDVIAINDVVCEIETAKSIVELPSPYAGTVSALLVEVGTTVPVGTPIISITDPREAAAAAPEASASAAVAGSVGSSAPEIIDTNVPPEGNVTLVGYGPRDAGTQRRRRRESPAPMSAGAVVAPADLRALAKPPVRKLAKDLGVDLATVQPTGTDGVITRADVESAARGVEPVAVEPAAVASFAQPAVLGMQDRREPIKGVRKMMAQAMVESAFSAPHVTEWVTVDATRTMEFVARMRARREFRELKISPLVVVARACLLALRRTPEINSTWDEAAGEVIFKGSCNLGIAAATPRGLVVPNIKAAERLSLPELAAALNEIAKTAREGRTQPADMTGGSFTITNVGVFGIDSGTPIINPGESAILAFGAIRKQPWVVTTRDASGAEHDEIAVRQVTTLALSFDHRHIDGALGSRFLADVAAIIEDPGNALLF